MDIIDGMVFWSCAAVFVSAVLLAGKCWAGYLWSLLNKKRYAKLRNSYLNSMLWMLFSGGDCRQCPQPRRNYQRRIAMENVADVARTTSGLRLDLLSPLIEDRGCLGFLLGRIRRSRGYRRAYYLQLLSYLPLSEATIRRVKRYTGDKNRYAAFYALCVQLARDPQEHLRAVVEHPYRLTCFEQMELLLRLQYDARPIDYQPMIASGNCSLQTLGIFVVWHFGIEAAKEELQRIVNNARGDIALEALYVLTSMNLPFANEEVASLLQQTKNWRRRSLLRFMARQGYSAMALQELVPEDDNNYYVSQVDSYKLNVGT